jgi:O-antigen/teichoic acid export membrane protein
MRSRLKMIARLKQSKLARNTLWLLSGQGLRFLTQAAYFSIIARSLGTSNYGAFVSAAAMVAIASPFASLGSGNLMIRDVARDQSKFRKCWGNALLRTLSFGLVMVALMALIARFALPKDIPLRLVLLISLADMIGLNLIIVSSSAFQALEQMNWTSGIWVALSLSRFLAALLLTLSFAHPTALQWSYAYLASTSLVVAGCLALVTARLGLPRLGLMQQKRDLLEGFFFSTSFSAQTIYNDLDKAMLGRLGTLQATGIYGAAYRIIEVCFAPVLALLSASYPRFFAVGTEGIAASLAFARPLVSRVFVFSCALSIALCASAGLLPTVLGAQYAEAATALRWLAPILPLRSIHAFYSDVLTSVGRQGLRTALQVGVAVVNAVANLWLIPAFSWKGAAWSSVGCDALLVLLAVSAVHLVLRSSARISLLPDVRETLGEAL